MAIKVYILKKAIMKSSVDEYLALKAASMRAVELTAVGCRFFVYYKNVNP